MKKPRILHKIYAHLFYYFWKPCPICGREFGGHEKLGGVLFTREYAPNSYVVEAVCENCGEEASSRNKGFLAARKTHKWLS